ncbi:MAG: hypothetical protein A4E74_00390 [Syntrophus sp. PtaB.Bin075]|nr:MAG: hypothetical protein A4E74_00390 [Syntrophus sp. PtaB.Bin075]
MIRKFLPDIVIAAVIVSLAFFFAAGPPPLPARLSGQMEKAGDAKPDREPGKPWVPQQPSDSALKKRNLFAESGSYDVKDNSPVTALPENPYALVAVLMGKEKKAVLRDFNGVIRTFPEGKKLIDGSVIAEIAPLAVKLKKGKETKELKVFDVHLRTSAPAKKETGKIGRKGR